MHTGCVLLPLTTCGLKTVCLPCALFIRRCRRQAAPDRHHRLWLRQPASWLVRRAVPGRHQRLLPLGRQPWRLDWHLVELRFGGLLEPVHSAWPVHGGHHQLPPVLSTRSTRVGGCGNLPLNESDARNVLSIFARCRACAGCLGIGTTYLFLILLSYTHASIHLSQACSACIPHPKPFATPRLPFCRTLAPLHLTASQDSIILSCSYENNAVQCSASLRRYGMNLWRDLPQRVPASLPGSCQLQAKLRRAAGRTAGTVSGQASCW